MFKFLIQNTDVEWSITTIQHKDNSKSYYLGTINNYDTDASQSYIIQQMLQDGDLIIDASHCHPNNSSIVSAGDIILANIVYKNNPKATLHIYTLSRINNPKQFDKDSVVGLFDEILVYPK